MSNSTQPTSTPRRASDGSLLRGALLNGPLAAAGFWSGVALPFLYVPLLLVGPSGVGEHRLAYVLIALHAVALLVGHSHRQRDAE